MRSGTMDMETSGNSIRQRWTTTGGGTSFNCLRQHPEVRTSSRCYELPLIALSRSRTIMSGKSGAMIQGRYSMPPFVGPGKHLQLLLGMRLSESFLQTLLRTRQVHFHGGFAT